MRDPDSVHDGALDAGDRTEARPAVDPRRGAVGKNDVQRPSLLRANPRRLDRGTPHQSLVSAVVVVRASEEVEAFARELERRRRRVRRTILDLGHAQRAGVDGQLDHHRFARGPRRVQALHGRAGVPQHAVVDADAREPVEAFGHRVAAGDDDPAPEPDPLGVGAPVVGHAAHHRGEVRQPTACSCARTRAIRSPNVAETEVQPSLVRPLRRWRTAC